MRFTGFYTEDEPQNGVGDRDELPLGGKQRGENSREDIQIRATPLGTAEEMT